MADGIPDVEGISDFLEGALPNWINHVPSYGVIRMLAERAKIEVAPRSPELEEEHRLRIHQVEFAKKLIGEKFALEAETERLRNMTRVVEPADTMTMVELCHRFSVARGTIYAWMKDKARPFPEPVGARGRARVWSRTAVAEWAKVNWID